MSLVVNGAAAAGGQPLKRKICAILAADVAGYSRLVADDEERTLRDLAAARHVFDALVSEAGGRIFNTAGDSVMCEFDSAVEAVRAAVAIQDAVRALGAAAEPGRRLAFRMGITIGDVVDTGRDLLGDGVNVAARLESLAPPGGICVSRSVHEAVANKVAASFTDLGPRTVKNIPQPIHAFLVRTEAAGPAPGTVTVEPRPQRDAPPKSGTARRRLLAAAAVSALVAGAGWSAWQAGMFRPTPAATGTQGVASGPVSATQDATVRAVPPKPTQTRPPSRPPADPSQTDNQAAIPRLNLREAYEAARADEAKGDVSGALKAYAALLPLVRDQVDPVMRYTALMRGRQGPDATRKAIEEAAKASSSRAVALMAASQGDPARQVARLEAFAAANPDFSPTDYMLGEAYLARSGGPTLTERRLAFDAFERFIAAEGRLAAFFLDQTVLARWLDGARQRRGEIEAFFAGAAGRPQAQFVPTETGWLARLTLPEPGSKVSAQMGERGNLIDSERSARPSTTAELGLPAGTGKTTLYVSYLDASGRSTGPFPIPFDPTSAKAAAARDTLERYPESWVSFRRDLPDLLSYAQLATNSCGIAKALIGFGDDPPTQPLAIPDCDARGSAPAGRSVLTLPAGTEAVQVQLAYADGTESRVRTFRRP